MIAKERVEKLSELAKEASLDGEYVLAKRYIQLIRKISQRNRIKFPPGLKRVTCKSCGSYLIPGRNSRYRLNKGVIVVTCECGSYCRYPYTRETRDVTSKVE